MFRATIPRSNSIICSSMASFYIPCVVMIYLYWRIFRAIHLRDTAAREQLAGQIRCPARGAR